MRCKIKCNKHATSNWLVRLECPYFKGTDFVMEKTLVVIYSATLLTDRKKSGDTTSGAGRNCWAECWSWTHITLRTPTFFRFLHTTSNIEQTDAYCTHKLKNTRESQLSLQLQIATILQKSKLTHWVWTRVFKQLTVESCDWSQTRVAPNRKAKTVCSKFLNINRLQQWYAEEKFYGLLKLTVMSSILDSRLD